jgi:hypothetical protein
VLCGWCCLAVGDRSRSRLIWGRSPRRPSASDFSYASAALQRPYAHRVGTCTGFGKFG